MTINMAKKVIELTKAEMKEAMQFGSKAYDNLQIARRDYPDYRVVEIRAKRSKADFAGLDKKSIADYVQKRGTDEQKETFKFISKKSIDEDGNYHEAQSFFEIKKWFLNEFPELKEARKAYREKVQKIFEEAEDKAVA